ncbi:lipase [Nocardia panacis]|uniref:Lipase n=1 Tax=Nocardia panacis TaxID=2340916 RepID=A0A3A4KSP7_9NOCA|nr:lipase family protein [Nocardia panacis]RJO79145.1 lipase [Nocardia panacis]
MKALATAVCAAFVGVCAPTAGADPAYPTPDRDPFYAAPANIGDLHPGDVVQTRKIDTGLYAGTDGWQISFRSTNSGNKPIMGITTVLMPRGVKNPPLISYQSLINSLGIRCQPSQALFNGELQDGPTAMVPIARGWAISLPDYLGPDVAYGAAKMSGMVTLDSVRAVKHVAELGLSDVPTVLAGYSGGGMATAWAAAEQPRYAPELKLTAAVAGGIPADLEQMARALGFSAHPGFGLAFAAAMGLEREYPDRLPISDQLNGAGLSFRDAERDSCRRKLLIDGLGHNADEFAKTKKLMDSPEAFAVLHENSLRYSDEVPTVPMYVWQGKDDFLTPFDAVSDVVDRYRKAGAQVQFTPVDVSEHLTAAVIGFPDAWNFVEDKLRAAAGR